MGTALPLVPLQVLQSLAPTLQQLLHGQPLQVQLKGLEYMNDDPSQVGGCVSAPCPSCCDAVTVQGFSCIGMNSMESACGKMAAGVNIDYNLCFRCTQGTCTRTHRNGLLAVPAAAAHPSMLDCVHIGLPSVLRPAASAALSQMHVMYLGVRDPPGSSGALQRLRQLCAAVVQAFGEAGLLLPQDERCAGLGGRDSFHWPWLRVLA